MLPKPPILVILTPGFPESEADTTCLPLQQALVKAIKEDHPGINPQVLSFEYPFKARNYTYHGVPVQAFGGRNKGKLFRLYNWLKVWMALTKLKKDYEIIGLLSFWLGECAFIGEQFARLHRLKHYCWMLGQDARFDNKYFTLAGIDSNRLVAISDFLVSNMETNYDVTPKHVIPGGIDQSKFEENDCERTIDIIGVGSLIPLKQYHLFLDVICRLRRRFPNIKAVICGAGPERARLMRMIYKLKIQTNVTLVEELPHPQVLAMMQQSKVLLHTSNYEGLVMVAPEALAAGAKVVSLLRLMDKDIPNWEIAENTHDAAEIITGILTDANVEYTPVVPFKIEDTAAQFVKLYTESNVVAISRKRLAIALKDKVAL
ncbi:glycosyltransferase [Mucilaginibacter boryungensis]|uniref:Glycosyltransferase n=1 Tax=Mucilaginibacter boryungensis TaxID=768480 RepID=A0ABR9XGF5_9SPHI|nr:glycosyltransferase [Mucilaginibacter boryungensis]MBE9666346.1 glycosyltransferase [Mucilaginibacter boryungensis]